jgi:hypothetical protein
VESMAKIDDEGWGTASLQAIAKWWDKRIETQDSGWIGCLITSRPGVQLVLVRSERPGVYSARF